MARFKDKDVILGTNEEVLFGDSQNASIQWDGSDLLIDQIPRHDTEGYLATQDYVAQVISGLEWQEAVLSRTTDIPAGVYGERYIIPSGASGAWSGLDDTIADYATTWVYTTPSAGMAAWVDDEGYYYVWNGSIWARMGSTISHSNLLDLDQDDHSQYLNVARHDLTARHGSAVVDHGGIGGLGDDDHSIYLTTGRHDTTDRHGSSVVDHGSIGGLDDDDHIVYFLTDGTRDLTGTLTISGSEGYISRLGASSLVTQLFCDPDNAVASSGLEIYVDGISSTTNRVLQLSKDTGSLEVNLVITDHYLQVKGDEGQDGLIYLYADDGDDQADWWRLRAGDDGLFAIQNYGATWEDAIYIDSNKNLTVTGDISAGGLYGGDHGSLTGLDDDDHTQYLHTDGRRPWDGTLTVSSTGSQIQFTEDLAYIGVSSNTDLMTLSPTGVTVDGAVVGNIDHDTLTNTHNLTTDIDHNTITNTHNLNVDIDHGSIGGLTDDDHPQYFLLSSSATVSGDILAGTAGLDIGSVGTPFSDIYCDTLHTSAGSVIIGSTTLTEVGGVLTSDSEIQAPSGSGDDSLATRGYVDEQVVSPSVRFPRGHLWGLECASDTDSSHDIAISVGECRDTADSENIELTSVLTKRIDADWSAGDNNGGFPSGLSITANTTYHFFVIKNTTSNVVDAGWDSSLTATNLLSDATGYTKYRRIGSFLLNSSSNIRKFFQSGDRFWYDTIIQHYIGASGTSRLTQTATVPTGIQIEADVSAFAAYNGTWWGLWQSIGQADDVPDATHYHEYGTAGGNSETIRFRVPTSNGQYYVRFSTNMTTYEAMTFGWYDTRGRIN
jgi:hypothetical protein